MRNKTKLFAIAALIFAACGDDSGSKADPSEQDASDAPNMMPDASDRLDANVDESTTPDSGPLTDSGTSDGGDGDGDGDSGSPLVPLPPNAREIDNVVNFVDDDAVAELELFLQPSGGVHPVLRQSLVRSVNMFLEHYEEVYDFVFVFTDHSLTSGIIGSFEAVTRPAQVGTGNEIEIDVGGYETNGRLKGVIGVQWRREVGPPLSHEIAHHWAAYLDPRFGFGVAIDENFGSHWGFIGLRGQLGGFDAETLRCTTPEFEPPPCTALPDGRFRYVISQFFPNSNPDAFYSPLELYLMGLIPVSEMPDTIQVLDEAKVVEDSFNPDANTVLVEAAGIRELPLADILARHGEVPLRGADERAFTAAFIVVSSEPASDEVMADVAEWAAAFGHRAASQVVYSFQYLTQDRATLDTVLGPRRATSSAVPPVRERFECDTLAQDCPRPELGCYGFSLKVCALSGQLEEGESCDTQYGCAPGLDCFANEAAPDVYSCNPYCDWADDASPDACAALCPGSELIYVDFTDEPVGAVCLP